MLNVGKIEEGFVLDHIKAGRSMQIYHHLGLDKLDCTVAIIKNARSSVISILWIWMSLHLSITISPLT